MSLNAKGYTLIEVMIAGALLSFLVIGMSTYMKAGIKLEKKSFSDLQKSTFFNELLYVLRDQDNCTKSFSGLVTSQSVTPVPSGIQKKFRSSDPSATPPFEYRQVYSEGDDLGPQWKLKKFELFGYQMYSEGFSGGEDVESGVTNLRVELEPTDDNPIETGLIQEIPLQVTRRKSDEQILNCYSNWEADVKQICDAFGGTLDSSTSFDRCKDITIHGDLNAANITATGDIIAKAGQVIISGLLNAGTTLADGGASLKGASTGAMRGDSIVASGNISVASGAGDGRICFKNSLSSRSGSYSGGGLDGARGSCGGNTVATGVDLGNFNLGCQ